MRSHSAKPAPRPAPSTTKPAWAEYLTHLRASRGLSATQAAHRMGITPQTWAGMEAGSRTRNGTRIAFFPREATLLRIARTLDLTPDERRRIFTVSQAPTDPNRRWKASLRSTRLAASLSQADAAGLAGVTISTYRGWERAGAGTARHAPLRTLLAHLGLDPQQVEEFMRDVPGETPPARAPRQPTKPVAAVPAWSRFLTETRLDRGLYLSQVDTILGQQSVVRRFELGGWQRADGRFSVPARQWLDRIAAALDMTPAETARLHLLADHQRLTVASMGPRPLLAELLHEVRRATGLRVRDAQRRVPALPHRWLSYEQGSPAALATFTEAHAHQVIDLLPVTDLLAAALIAATRTAAPPLPLRTDSAENVQGAAAYPDTADRATA